MAAQRQSAPNYSGAPEQHEAINDSLLALFPSMGSRMRLQPRQSYLRASWAYDHNHAYSSCVDLLAGCILANGEDPTRRPWRCEPRRDENDEQIKNPDESQLAPWYRFVESCHPQESFTSLLRPLVIDFVMSNSSVSEISRSPIRNQFGEPQPGGLWYWPQQEIFPKIDAHGELDQDKPFWQIRQGQEPRGFGWLDTLWLKHGTIRAKGSIFPKTPLDGLGVTIDSADAAERVIRSYFKSVKFGNVFGKDDWSAEEAIQFITDMEKDYTDPDAAFRAWATWGGLSVKDPPTNMVDFAKFLEILRYNARQVCSRFRTDPRLVSAQSEAGLGTKSDRGEIWMELLLGPVNDRKLELTAQLTFQFFRQGFGITDWDLVLVPYRDAEDAAAMAQIAMALKTADEAGIVNWKKLSDLELARKHFNGNLAPVNEEELATWPAPILRGTPEILKPDQAQVGPDGQPLPPEAATKAGPQPAPVPPAETVKAERARRPAVIAAREMMDSWTESASSEIAAKLKDSISKGVRVLEPIYTAAVKDGMTDSQKSAFDKANLLPASGQLAADFRKAMKTHYSQAKDLAASEIAAAAKKAIGKRSATSDAGLGEMNNFLEMLGAHVFDDLYDAVTSSMRATFLAGLRHGWDREEFLAQVAAHATSVAEADLITTIRTASTDVFNIGRQNAAEESEIVIGYQYDAILDDRTAPVCEAADGLQIAIHDPDVDRIRPPNHYNCRCVYSFILAGEDIETDRGQIARVLAMIPPNFGGKLG